MTFLSLGLYLLLMLAIGVYGYRTASADLADYMLGGRRLHPAVGALSAGASDMSGWMLMGLPGAVFVSGLSAAWIAVGLCIGAYLNYLLVAPRLRIYTAQANDALTLPDFFAQRFDGGTRTLRVVASVIIVIFFTLYTSSGMVAGGRLFETAFATSYSTGLAITASVVVLYTLIGGFLAVSLTDFVQGTIMFCALLLVPIAALIALGGPAELTATLANTEPARSSLMGALTGIGLLSALAWGLGYFGQPHIIVRFMAIRSAADMPVARRIGMGWMLVTVIGAVATGLIGYAWHQARGGGPLEPETIFIVLAQVLFHPLIAGFLLAAILAAIMSTISSQLLVSSSSLTEDFYRAFLRRGASDRELVRVGRSSVLLVAGAASLLALDPDATILSLVSNAWAGFGAAFGPLVLLTLYWERLTRGGALAGMLTGAGTVLFCVYIPVLDGGRTLSDELYEIVPGFLLALIASLAVSLAQPAPAAAVRERHREVRAATRAIGAL
ncbi:MAG: sodium/proline symporter PutP [Pseudomonadota bacterium]